MAASSTYRLVACAVVALSSAWAATPASAAGRAITTDDVAFGGQELAQTVKVPAGGTFATVLRIRDIKFGPGEDVRAALQGVLSVRNLAKAGSTVVKLRMVINGKPEPMLFSQTVAAGRTRPSPFCATRSWPPARATTTTSRSPSSAPARSA